MNNFQQQMFRSFLHNQTQLNAQIFSILDKNAPVTNQSNETIFNSSQPEIQITNVNKLAHQTIETETPIDVTLVAPSSLNDQQFPTQQFEKRVHFHDSVRFTRGKRNWGRIKAKQLHNQCNQQAAIENKRS